MPFGEVRTDVTSPFPSPTDFTYTGQRDLPGTGLMDYKARMYSPYINRFVQPDTIIPSLANPQSWNRYSYVYNNPIRYKDPSGHKVTCDVDENCNQSQKLSRLTGVRYWKALIKDEFGVKLDDGGAQHPHFKESDGLKWDEKNAQLVFTGLSNMDDLLGGNLKKTIGSATFTLNTHPVSGKYLGWTSYTDNHNVVDFYQSSTIPLHNLYHEFGHVLDNSTGGAFSTALKNSVHKSDDNIYWFGGEGNKLDSSVLLKSSSVDDPYFGARSIDDVFQHNDGTPTEQWADIWANYSSDNIDLTKEGGLELWTWVFAQTAPYATSP